MERFFIEKGFMNNIYVTDTEIMGSDENYETQEVFVAKVTNGEKGKLDTHVRILYGNIDKLVLFREENGIQVFYKENGKQTKTYLQFKEQSDFKEVLKFILSKNTQLKPSVEKSGSLRAILYPVIYTFMALVVTWIVVENAIELENGNSVAISGGKKGLKTLMLTIAETLGVWGSLIIGGLITMGLAFYVFKTYKDSKAEREIYTI